MALLEVSPVNSIVEGVTRNQLFKRFLRETGLGSYGIATSGGSGIINDTVNLLSTQFTTSDWPGGWARIAKDAGGAAAAPEGEINPITTYDPITNGRITTNPVFTANPAVGDEYELWKYPNPNLVKDFLDQCLKNDIYLPCWTILSEIPDYDMEANNVLDWTASNATVTKITDTEPEGSNFSKRKLSVVTTSTNGYARTATIKVEPTKRYHVSAVAMSSAASTTAQLQCYDVTNSAEILSKTSNRQYPNRIDFDITTPATCNQVQIRLIGQENSVTVYWDEVVFYSVDNGDIALPWWVKNKAQVKAVFEVELYQLGDSVYDATLRGPFTNKFDIVDNAFGRGQLRLTNFRGSGFNKPLAIFGIRNEVAYANDNTDIKRVDENLLFYCLAYKVFTYLKQMPTAGALNSTWIAQQVKDYSKLWTEYQTQQSERIEDIIQSKQAAGYFESRNTMRGY